jgi:hypothetical protein
VVAEADGEVLGLAVCSPSTAPGGVEDVGCRAEVSSSVPPATAANNATRRTARPWPVSPVRPV